MDTELVNRQELLDSLYRSEGIVNQVFDYVGRIQNTERMLTIERQRTPVPHVGKRPIVYLLLATAWFIIFIVLTTIVLEIMEPFNNVNRFASITGGIISFLVWIMPIIFAFRYYGVQEKKAEKIAKEEQANACEEYEKRIRTYYQAINETLSSQSGQFARGIIPEDYFYPEAAKMFIFYIKNGQADSMKEALREYDQYLHRCKIEFETKRMADASERTARASERTAQAAEQTANAMADISQSISTIEHSVRTIEQYSANTNFWVTYNSIKYDLEH